MALVFQKNLKTPIRQKQDLYSDFSTNFSLSESNRDIEQKFNEDAVKVSILNLIKTNKGDRLFNNTFGGNLNNLLFENFGVASEEIISDSITQIIENYEPRASLISVIVDSDVDDHLVNITIIFRVINNSEPVLLEIVLHRIR